MKTSAASSLHTGGECDLCAVQYLQFAVRAIICIHAGASVQAQMHQALKHTPFFDPVTVEKRTANYPVTCCKA
jgi:hypothetical protein